MKLSPRKRFILYVVCSYLFFGSTWIFFSDRLLLAFTDISALARLSTAKGILFIVLTAILLIMALLTIPDRDAEDFTNRYKSSRFLSLTDHLPRWIAYVLAVAVSAAMLVVRMSISAAFGHRPMLILFMLPIILSSVLGGFGPGIVATVIVSLGIDFYGIPPMHSFWIAESHDLFQWFILIVSGILSSYLSELLHRARRQAEERRRLQETAQEDLRQSETRFSTIFQASPMGINLVQVQDGRITHANSAYLQMFGYGQEEVIGRTTAELGLYVDPEDRNRIFEQLRQGQRVTDLEVCFRKKSGDIGTLLLYVEPIELGRELYALSINLDITRRKEDEAALRFQYEIMIHMAEAVYLVRLEDGIIVYTNSIFEKMFGYDPGEMIGQHVAIVNAATGKDAQETAREIMEIIREKGLWKGEVQNVKKDGTPFWCYANVSVFDHSKYGQVFIALHTDISDRKRAEAEKIKLETQLLQSQKMESIGALAGGIAHDLNNILFPITGLSEMLMHEMPPESQEYGTLQQIYRSARRGSDLVKQILAFSRRSNPRKIPIRLQSILEEAISLVRSTIPKNVEITTCIEKNCGMVSADPTQMHQILMNLITNAYHALDENAGKIQIALKEATVDEEAGRYLDMSPGKYARITVSDTGTGITQGLMGKIFDPYFTTKEQGKGTGLGLSVVHGIVKEHEGDIRVYSEPGKGSTFNIYLPLLANVRGAHSGETLPFPTGNERLLLVDDEEPIALMEQMLLEKLGYQITTRTSSTDALATFKADPARFDLVISDLGMPEMTGIQLAKSLRSIRPDMPVVLCSGFVTEQDEQSATAAGVKKFLMKPVATGDLAKTVRQVLDERKEAFT